MSRRVRVYFDGGCRPNPGPIEAAVVLRGVARYFDELGEGTNTRAEWQALLCAVTVARDLPGGLAGAELIGDSLEVVREAAAVLAGGAPASAEAAALLDLLVGERPGRVRWIRRAQNLAGIALERRRAGLVRPLPVSQ
jgi:ribonuclease HI